MCVFLRAGVRLALLGLLLTLSVGCGKPPEDSGVAGDVYVDGEPLKKGLIRFVPTDGKSRAGDSEVIDGKYKVKVPPGECRVEITAPKVIGKKKMYDTPDSHEVDQITELLPTRYNTESTLMMTVAPGQQSKRFDVQSK